ncbi:MAG: hypothetical protein AB7U85_07150 [Alphaproteobacteria bacterium]
MKSLVVYIFILVMFSSSLAKAQVNIRRNIPEADFLEEHIDVPIMLIPNYRDVMRDMVSDLSVYLKGRNPEFDVLAREGLYLLFRGEWEQNLYELRQAQQEGLVYDDEKFIASLFRNEEDAPPKIGTPIRRYLQSIDAEVIEGIFCDNNPPDKETSKIIKDAGLITFGIEHCRSKNDEASAVKDAAVKEIALHIDNDLKAKFDNVPEKAMAFENPENIKSLKDVRNFLMVEDTKKFGNRGEFILALSNTNYDMLVIDPFFKGSEALLKEDITALKFKKLGARRKVIARVNLTEAEDFRYYWKRGWRLGIPSWLRMISKENPYAIVVEYWNPEWKEIIGNYVRAIFDLGFDGIMFEGLDAHLRFERLTPID